MVGSRRTYAHAPQRVWGVVAMSLISACSPPPNASQRAALGAGRPTSVPDPLPPGNYFRHGYSTCPTCETPQWAVVLAIVDDGMTAASIARSSAAELPVGYPWIQHTDDLALDETGTSGVAIVGGLFASSDAARTWMRATRLPAGSRLVRLTPSAVAIERWQRIEASEGGGAELHTVVTIADGEPVPAYAPDAVRDTTGTIDPESAPSCIVRPFDTFVITHDELFGPRSRDFAPVRCRGELAYVRWTSTSLESTVLPYGDHGHRLVQVVDVSCDRPTFAEWDYDRAGRRPLAAGHARIGPVRDEAPCEDP